MDLLYSRYASPMELMNIYIENGRFGEFVEKIVELDNKRKTEAAEKENEQKLWMMYVHSEVTDMSFNEWKSKVLKGSPKKEKTVRKGTDTDMTDDDIEKLIDRLFPKG
ncbi:MAG: hypothetical protein IKW21_07740 [Lachnospiraceae bacterium]|nr:hypothetical protein [Lachnospiraceae bacterium]